MKSYFDQELENRRAYYSVKYHAMDEQGMKEGIPLWVADMDLPVSPAISEALVQRARHPYFGYTYFPEEYFEAFAHWHKKQFGSDIDVTLVAPAHNVVVGLQLALEMLREPGDGVLVQPPVYFPFYSIIEKAQCTRIDNPLVETDQGYKMDFEDMERKIKEHHVKVMILCHPHNPVGRAWKKEELERLVDICYENHVFILSDEIHSDLIHKGKHLPLYLLNEKAREISASFYSTGKTFNLAAVHSAFALFNSKEKKELYDAMSEKQNRGDANCFGIAANIAAYRRSDAWYEEMMAYIQGNIDYVSTFIQENLSPRIKVRAPEATFLMWLDCRGLGLSQEELGIFFKEKANLLLNEGYIFGQEGSGFMRLNIAAPRYLLEEAMRRLKEAVHELSREKH